MNCPEDLINGVLRLRNRLVQQANVGPDLLPDEGTYQLILIIKVLVNGFFGHAEFGRNIIHGDAFDPVPAEKPVSFGYNVVF